MVQQYSSMRHHLIMSYFWLGWNSYDVRQGVCPTLFSVQRGHVSYCFCLNSSLPNSRVQSCTELVEGDENIAITTAAVPFEVVMPRIQ